MMDPLKGKDTSTACSPGYGVFTPVKKVALLNKKEEEEEAGEEEEVREEE